MKSFTGFIAALFCLLSCTAPHRVVPHTFGIADINTANRKLLEVAMEDGFSPPIASRVYVYPHIAHYLALQKFYPDSLPDLAGKLNGLSSFTNISAENANPELTALLAFCKTAKKVVFSEFYMDEQADQFKSKAKSAGITNSEIEASDKCAAAIAKQLIDWINKDNYVQTRTMDRFTSSKKPGEWRETPPDYINGLEPHWMKMRPLLIDSAGIYTVTPPPQYTTTKNSAFYNMVSQVYKESKILDTSKKEIALYWDDNPNTSEHRGHLMTIIHKISPPGHWLNIIAQISNREKSSLFKTTKAYTYSAIAMYDGVISCWHEKYKTNLVRPVSYIQEFIDINWKPLIQTPPFPEYTSGHSVISASAATVLTSIYGDNYVFTDSTETIFEQPIRKFDSFNQAAWEVSLSRFYAGIHYMNGVTEGNKQGNYIGQIVINKFK